MAWKNLSGWLKGGIIAVVIWVILMVLLYFSFQNSHEEGASLLGGAIMVVLSFPSLILLLTSLNPWEHIVLSGIIILIVYFIIGALIGLIISKIKSGAKK